MAATADSANDNEPELSRATRDKVTRFQARRIAQYLRLPVDQRLALLETAIANSATFQQHQRNREHLETLARGETS
jgi:hypothetical protein